MLCSISCAQELPPILNYTPKTYNADNQNWMISQSSDSYMYIANNKGLLEFNGAQWKLYKTPNETIVRSVKVINDKVYTGFYQNFGCWIRNDKGILEYTSLSDQSEIEILEDEQFWNIVQLDKWVLFQSLSSIYSYHTETKEFKVIRVDNILTKLYKIDEELYFHVLNEGLYTIENGEKKLINDDPVLKNDRIVGFFRQNKKKLIITLSNGWFRLDDNGLTAVTLPYQETNNQKSIYTSIQLSDGGFVLGTISEGILHISKSGELLHQIDQADGLSDNTALSLFEDAEGNIWVGLDNGIDCINRKEPFKYFADQKGRLGTIYASIIHNGYVYLGTNQGLFYRKEGAKTAFKFVEGTKGQIWCLRVIDDELFCGHDLGTFLIQQGTQRKISNVLGAWDIRKVPGKSNMFIQGNYKGLYLFTKENNTWQLSHKLKNFNISSKHFEWISPTKILMNHEYKGVYELEISEDYQSVIAVKKNNDVQKSANSSLIQFSNTIYQANKNGIYGYDVASATFKKDTILSSIFENDEYTSGKLVVDNVGYLWAFTKNYINYVTKEKLNGNFKINKIAISESLRNEMKGYENIAHLKGKNYLLGTSDGYITINLDEMHVVDYEISINNITSTSLVGGMRNIVLGEEGDFKAKENYLSFAYSIPAYNKYEVAEYSYHLDGLYEGWSDWSTKPTVAFENLPHGNYTFKVKARINNQETVNTASYTFKINRPWFLSNLAIAIYIILTILLFTALNGFYKRYYRKQRERLLEKTTRDLALKELEAQKEIIQLKNSQLNSDIDAKNRELAIATMNMIKKNETLNSIKQELNKQKGEQGQNVTPVIRLIDKNINNAEDWKFFEEAFNHADKDFFKKVKDLHPQLTANDLRLCAYLRLNLSSKEIAPLLNISVRSVEIKRYRLRKKISLAREINLNDYFLNL